MISEKILTIRARQLRKNQTDAENLLWHFLRNRFLNGYKFKRQQVMGKYIIDFVCEKKKIIIELDGGQHFDAQSYDETRTRYLEGLGYKVLRFWNDDVFKETDGVLEVILSSLESNSLTLTQTLSHND